MIEGRLVSAEIADTEEVAGESPNEATEFFRSIRAKADRSLLPKEVAYPRPAHGRGVTQEEVHGLLRSRGVSVSFSWLARGETGRVKWSAPLAGAYADALDLSDAERAVLNKLVLDRLPLGWESRPVTTDDEVSEVDRDAVDDMTSHAAYINDGEWVLRHRNALMAEWLPPLKPGVSIIRWALTSEEAREWLVDWERHWATSFIATLRTALYFAEGALKMRLESLVDELRLASPDVERLWGSRTYHLGPKGDVRQMNLPATGLITVRLGLMLPFGMPEPGWRLMTMKRLTTAGT